LIPLINKFSFTIATFNSLLNHSDSEQSFPSSISYDLNDKDLLDEKVLPSVKKELKELYKLRAPKKTMIPYTNFKVDGPTTFSKIKNYENFEQINQ